MSHFETIDTHFFYPRVPVGIVALGDAAEALMVRAFLENMGAVTVLHLPGTPSDFLLILGQQENIPPYLVICGHGDEVGFVFEEYVEGIDTSALSGISMPPASIAKRVHLPGCVVVSTACMSGCEAMGQAFLQGQVKAYIAPSDYPSGSGASLFLMHLFHRLIVRGASLEKAWTHAATYDEESRMFVLYTHEGVQRHSVTHLQ